MTADIRLSLLVVDDEEALARLWVTELSSIADVTITHTLDDARFRLQSRAFDVVLLDLRLPDGSGLELLSEIRSRSEEISVVILTANADLNSAIQALRLGADDYLLKPCRIAEVEQHLVRVTRERRLRDENRALRQQIRSVRPSSADLIGQTEPLVTARRLIARVAPTHATVLITGETGTGKEVAARMVHEQSLRAAGPFVPVNCASLPPNLVESEFFGHRKGAFTGADRDHRGLISAAASGTLFLDEVGELPAELQGKLLRFLETGEARRVGDSEPYSVSTRVVAATNRDLASLVSAGRFRQDLYYRLSTFELRLPPLRAIRGDIPDIAMHLLERLDVPNSTAIGFDANTTDQMKWYDWPGNVRELRNVIERAKILCDGTTITSTHLQLPTVPEKPVDTQAGAGHAPDPAVAIANAEMTLQQVARVMIRRALIRFAGNKTAAAKSLGISLRTLYNKLQPEAADQQAEAVAEYPVAEG